MFKKILEAFGLNKNGEFVRGYFYHENMKSSIYMSVIIIVLEAWMIIRLTKIIIRDHLQDNLAYYFENYYSNYIVLIVSAIVMLIFSVLTLKGKLKARKTGRILLLTFSFISLSFGIKVAMNDYSKGEQILVFITMALYAVCLLTWRPIISFVIMSASFGFLYIGMDNMVAVNTGEVGTTDATKINYFIMFISVMMVCISGYNSKRSQALKDEDLIRINSHLEKTSVTDEMTGIHNMFYFRSEAEKLLAEEGASGKVCLFLDIENFKSYNEKYGFHEGNGLLKRFAEAVDSTFSDSVSARYSDDHFVVLTEENGCAEAVERLADEVSGLRRDIQLQLKCGAYRHKEGETDVSVACDRARFACNSIKKHYGEHFRMYDKLLEDSFTLRNYIVNNIDNAVENGSIKAYYQPLISADTGIVCGFEALARWEDPYYGLLPPGTFISTLEECRQIHKLDLCMIGNVCRDFDLARSEGIPVVPVSLNFSRLDFELCDIISALDEAAERYSIPHSSIDVEITESALTDSGDVLHKAIASLREKRYNIWLDDFGSGYSSLNVLKDYSFDVMKIDMNFLKGFGSNEKTNTILESVVRLSKQLGMTSLTEGIETSEQLDFLRSIGCDKVQGYFFGKPAPYDQVTELIKKGKLKMQPLSTKNDRR